MKSNFITGYFKFVALLFCFFTFHFANAQNSNGIHFEHGIDWPKVLAKAKEENKLIFIDCFTTWCGPCKMMSSEIFPLEEVGNFYNKHFINVKLQLDKTPNDNEEVVNWRPIASKFEEEYKVNVYPTYLFFDYNGNILHRSVGANYAKEFIELGNNAIEPKFQFYTLKKNYESGNGRDSAALMMLAKAATEAYDQPLADKVIAEYLAKQKNLLTETNIKLIASTIHSDTQLGFNVMLKNPEAFNKYTEPGYAQKTIRNIIISEYITPQFKNKTIKEPVDWNTLALNSEKKYKGYGNEAVSFFKIVYYQSKKDWKNFVSSVDEIRSGKNNTLSAVQLNEYAWTIFEKCDIKDYTTNALLWSKLSLVGNEKNDAYLDTYANLLYKSGDVENAIEFENKAKQAASAEDAKGYQETIDKMKGGIKTW